ncbi:MAG TPA: response regulator [Candidatus Paceibacterota bacterium]|nr:response regulator [Candidatus Paceibacterota bacterium]
MEPTSKSKKILIVEDDRALRTILGDRLREDAYEVIEASDGEAGLQMAKESHPDLILLDIIMPKMDGIEMLAELRKDVWGKGANVIMLTNLSAEDQKSAAREQGVADYLVKSDWDIEGIVDCIKSKIKKI